MFARFKSLRHHHRIAYVLLSASIILALAAGVIVRDRQERKQVLRVGFNQFAPFLMVDEAKQKPSGLAALVLQEAARRADIPIRWVYVEGTADPALRAGKIDLFPILTATDQRKSEFYGSQPWWENEIALISRETSFLQTAQDTEGKRVGVRAMPAMKKLAQTLFPKAHIVVIPEMDKMLKSLCADEISGFFLDVRLLQSQLLKETPSCTGGMHVASIPNGAVSLSTYSRHDRRWAAGQIYEQLTQMAVDGTLSGYASHWSLYNPFQSLHVKEGLEAAHRVQLLRIGLAGMVIVVILIGFQSHRIRCEQKATERARQELSFQASHDPLTGLPNRRHLQTRLLEVIEEACRESTMAAVLYLDLDGFKLVNDTLGHGVGDALLKIVSSRLQSCLRECDILFRIGGDEFTLLLTKLPDAQRAQRIAERLLASFQESFLVEGHELMITTSIGISVFPSNGKNGGELLQQADAAMYESKRRGKNRIHSFTPEMRAEMEERLNLEHYLRRALERKQFSLHFQPEVCLGTGKILRHEALLRWNHPVLGAISPAKFIPIAEDTNLIVPIGTWVLEEACRQATAWQAAGSEGVGVAVNVSIIQFGRRDFIENVRRVLQTSGLPGHLLELELTESVVMQGVEDAGEKIRALQGLGVKVSLDDFGTGYSSLSYLKRLPFDHLKVDRSFTSGIETEPDAVKLLKALIFIAHSLRMKIVVEGIETSGQLDLLQEIGCDIGQGYWLGRPSAIPANSPLNDWQPREKEVLYLCA